MATLPRTPVSAVLAVLVGFALFPSLAEARNLWNERPKSQPALAKVPNFAALAKQVIPAVVSVHTEQGAKMSRGGDPFDLFRLFGGGGRMPRQFAKGMGSGFVIRADGLILTNNHVVEDADSIEVAVVQPDGSERRVAAKVLGSAPNYDVALLQTEEKLKVPVAYLGNSDDTDIGDWVMAVGNPFGLSHSISVGIVSAKERRDIAPSGRRGIYDFIQTDASINPGNSGGPLINVKGEVIGINSAINAAGSGIGFAIPINMVKRMLPDLKEKGRYVRSWIGIRIQPMTEGLAGSFGLKDAHGALVADVVAGSPAEKAGLKPGDVILEFEGEKLRDQSDLLLRASMAGAGKRVKLRIWRDGDLRNVKVILEEKPQDDSQPVAQGKGGATGELGMTVADITPALQQRFDLSVSSGVVVKEVAPGSTAARAGLRPGDLILSVNGKPMKRARTFAKEIRGIESGDTFRLHVEQLQGGRLFLPIAKP